MSKRRFILVRGIIGFGVPMFLFLALSHLAEDIHSAHVFHTSVSRYLLGHWIGGFCISAFLGFVIAF